MSVDPPEPVRGSKEAKLARLRTATAEELAIPGHRDAMIQEAVDAGATGVHVDDALSAPR